MASISRRSDPTRSRRVQITYDLDVGGRTQRRELPFVIGVLGDFAGKPDEPLPRLRDRKFVEVDRKNFNAVLKGMKPRLVFSVDNKLAGDDSRLGVELHFTGLEDFEPEQVARQVPALGRLIALRRELMALRASVAKRAPSSRGTSGDGSGPHR
jgi:type VI secretion system protein ImpB